jgi:hypothetical protein
MLDYDGIIALGKTFPGRKANCFIEMFRKGIDYSYYCEEQ